MTFHFTALGILIAFCWVQAAAAFVIALASAIEGKGWKSLGYVGEAAALTFLLIVR